MKLEKILILRGKVLCETGLHIGGSQEEIEIGSVDNPIIKHPITREPYIPGSSLKGKMRSQLEKKYGKVSNNGEPCGCGRKDCYVCRIFGAHKNTKHELGPTRILVRDANLSEKSRQEFMKLAEEKGISYIETKTENIIDRIRGMAQHPRTQERVPSGTMFDLEIALQVFDIDDEKALIGFVKEGLIQVEDTYLGGYGSRGSGKVKFIDLTLDGEAFTLRGDK
jgi:CRISPR-associated protein Csm3